MRTWKMDCPAKLNLFLAITGRRPDGYHELLSLAVTLDHGDTLEASKAAGKDSLACDDTGLDCGPVNLVLKAAAVFRARFPHAPFMAWRLAKRVPYGAGMGGGSSDATAAIRILADASGVTDPAQLRDAAAAVGSDCPLFLAGGPCIMRGRGQIVDPLAPAAAAALKGRGVVVVKPHFAIPTKWAYSALDEAGAMTPSVEAEAILADWLAEPSRPLPMLNSFEALAFGKYGVYEVMNERLLAEGLPTLHLTGSGSACFAFAEGREADAIAQVAIAALGDGSFVRSARIA